MRSPTDVKFEFRIWPKFRLFNPVPFEALSSDFNFSN